MTRKHFQALAELVATYKGDPLHERLANDLARFCREHGDNPNFKPTLFLATCKGVK